MNSLHSLSNCISNEQGYETMNPVYVMEGKKMNYFHDQTRNKPRSIGVFGLHQHAGVTWVTVLLAQYLSEICGLEVMLVEKSQKRDLVCLVSSEEQSEIGAFKIHNITYQTYVERDVRSRLTKHQTDCYVYDLGCNYAKARESILTCDHVIMMYTMTPWYFDYLKASLVLERDYGSPEHISYLGNMVAKRERKQLKKLIPNSQFMDYEPDLYSPSKQCIQIFHNILWN